MSKFENLNQSIASAVNTTHLQIKDDVRESELFVLNSGLFYTRQ